MSHAKVGTLTLLILLFNALSGYRSLCFERMKNNEVLCNDSINTRNLRNFLRYFHASGEGVKKSKTVIRNVSNISYEIFEQNISRIINNEPALMGALFLKPKTVLSYNKRFINTSQYVEIDSDRKHFESAKLSGLFNESYLLNNFTNNSIIYKHFKYDFASESDFYYHNGSDYSMQRTLQEERLETKISNSDFARHIKPCNISKNPCDATANKTDTRLNSTSKMKPNVNATRREQDDLIDLFKSRYPVNSWYKFGYFTETYLQTINKHWLQFEPPLRSSHYIMAALYSIVMTVGVGGNCFVIFMYARCRSLRIPANTLVINLAVSDFIMLIKMPIFIFNSFYFGPVLGEPGCQLYGFLGGLTGTVSIMTLAAIALDRYYAIVYPLDPLRKTTHLRARLLVLFVWSYGCIFAGLPLTKLGLNRYVPEGYLTSCSFDYLTSDVTSRIFIFIFFVAAWLLPFSVITICYFGIFVEVVKAGSVAPRRRGQEAEKRRIEIRLASMVIGVIGLWFLAWTPYAIVALLGIFGFHNLISPLGSMIPALFCKSASCIDPYIYAFSHPRFRQEMARLFLPRRNRVLQRYRTRSRFHTCTSKFSSQLKQPRNSCTVLELDEMKTAAQQNIQPSWDRTLIFYNSFLPKLYNTDMTSKSLQNSKISTSEDYSITNSSPF